MQTTMDDFALLMKDFRNFHLTKEEVAIPKHIKKYERTHQTIRFGFSHMPEFDDEDDDFIPKSKR